MKQESIKLEDIRIIPLEDQLCHWTLSRQIVELGGKSNSYFKWVHPWSRIRYKENKRKYVICEWLHVSNRTAYPAYTVTELSFYISDNILGFNNWDGWYCKDATDTWDGIKYYSTIIEACAYCYIDILKEIKRDTIEEELIKERGLQ